jgi:CubicO group peptidase (beta-lactamase class C family)
MQQRMIVPETVGISAERLSRIRPAMQRYVDQGKNAGISTMIARHGQVVHFEQVGWLDKEENKPLTADAIFRIYSMTKPVVCTALMILYEQGHFQLFDPVAKFIPAFADLKVLESTESGDTRLVALERPVTIQHLLTHTAGLTYGFLEDSPVGAMYRQAELLQDAGKSLADFVAELTRLPLAYQPGSRWHYSVAIDVVAYLIELISGQSLNRFLREKLFHPLGMADTDFYVPPSKAHRLATMYGLPDVSAPDTTLSTIESAWKAGFNKKVDVSESYPATDPDGFARGGHGLFSTAWDYMRFAQMLLNQGYLDGTRILGRKTVELMHTNHLPAHLLPYKIAEPPAYGYGFGLGSRVLLNVAQSRMPGSVGEFGWSGAAKTYYWVDPQEKLVGLLMSQAMMQIELPQRDFQVLAYQAVVD